MERWLNLHSELRYVQMDDDFVGDDIDAASIREL